MKPSRKFLSLPIVSLSEGQHIGYVKNLVIDAQAKTLAALVIDPKGFFKDQRIIPYTKVVSVGDDAITIDKGAHVEKSTTLPEILNLIKEKLSVIGTRVITQSGKTLGIVEEYFVDPDTGKILQIEISGGKLEGFLSGKALLDAQYIMTIGQDVIVTEKGCENHLMIADKGLNDSLKTFFHSTSSLASGTSQVISKYFKKTKNKSIASEEVLKNNMEAIKAHVIDLSDSSDSLESASFVITENTPPLQEEAASSQNAESPLNEKER